MIAKYYMKAILKIIKLVEQQCSHILTLRQLFFGIYFFRTFLGDMTNEDDVMKMIDQTIHEFGRLDILVNNAGILELGTIENSSLEQYDRVMNTNMRFVSK